MFGGLSGSSRYDYQKHVRLLIGRCFAYPDQATVAGDAAPDWRLTAFSGEEIPFPPADAAPSILLYCPATTLPKIML